MSQKHGFQVASRLRKVLSRAGAKAKLESDWNSDTWKNYMILLHTELISTRILRDITKLRCLVDYSDSDSSLTVTLSPLLALDRHSLQNVWARSVDTVSERFCEKATLYTSACFQSQKAAYSGATPSSKLLSFARRAPLITFADRSHSGARAKLVAMEDRTFWGILDDGNQLVILIKSKGRGREMKNEGQ